MLSKGLLLTRSLLMRQRACWAGLPGMAFDFYGRRLALREMRNRQKRSNAAWYTLLNPISCVRYFEFDYASRAVLGGEPDLRGLRVLDVSSPRLFPFWLAEAQGAEVNMVNPDPCDLARSREVAAYAVAERRLKIGGEEDATRLSFADNSFDVAVSISVIEHVSNDGDTSMVEELARVVRPGGRIVLTFPVKPKFENEHRDVDYYNIQNKNNTTGNYFFQRFYDEQSIIDRILSASNVTELHRQYFVEDPPGWFARYEREWMRSGVAHTLSDPWFMTQHFRDAGPAHPSDRTGVCGLSLEVKRSPDGEHVRRERS